MNAINLERVVAELQTRRGAGTVLVGIDGFGGSGKSTIAEALRSRLGDAVVVSLDDFIVKDHIDDDSWERVWDRERLLVQVLVPVSQGLIARYQPLDWASNELGEERVFEADGFLIVEGITALHPDLRAQYDYRIWIDAPIEAARTRGAARDAGHENEARWEHWSQNDLAYAATHRPREHADAIIEN